MIANESTTDQQRNKAISVGDTVQTKNFGRGVVVESEFYNRVDGGTKRFGLHLENNPFFYDVVFFWPHEIDR